MSLLEVQPSLDDPTGGGQHVTHWMCCEEKRGEVAFCGTPLAGAGDLAPEELPNCVVCDSLANADTDAICPYDRRRCPPETP